MFLESCKSILYSDTLLPDIFITEYMPSMDGDYLKVYVQCLFLCKNSKHISVEELARKLQLEESRIRDAFSYLESVGAIERKEKGIAITDLKEKEIKKVYRMKATSTPEEAAMSTERNKKRNSIVTAINNTFFQGLMAPSWYTDIDAWFDRYNFDEDVMYALFQHCANHSGLTKPYIVKVADNWRNKNIKNYFDLEKYLDEYQKFKDIKSKVIKKLKLSRNLTEYEEEYIEKWVMDYGYDFDIIDLSLKKTAAKTNPNVKYVHAILTAWFEKGLMTREKVIAYEKEQKAAASNSSPKHKQKDGKIPQHANFRQRQYDDEFFNSLYENAPEKKKD